MPKTGLINPYKLLSNKFILYPKQNKHLKVLFQTWDTRAETTDTDL